MFLTNISTNLEHNSRSFFIQNAKISSGMVLACCRGWLQKNKKLTIFAKGKKNHMEQDAKKSQILWRLPLHADAQKLKCTDQTMAQPANHSFRELRSKKDFQKWHKGSVQWTVFTYYLRKIWRFSDKYDHECQQLLRKYQKIKEMY